MKSGGRPGLVQKFKGSKTEKNVQKQSNFQVAPNPEKKRRREFLNYWVIKLNNLMTQQYMNSAEKSKI